LRKGFILTLPFSVLKEASSVERKILVAIVAVAIAAIAIGAVIASGILNQPTDKGTVYYKVVAPKDQAALIAAGDIAGGVSWEPYVSDSILGGTGKILINSKDVWPGHPCCVIIVRKDFADSNPNLVNAVLKAHIEANRWIAKTIAEKETNPTNYTALLQMGAGFSNRNTSVVEAALGDMILDYGLEDPAISDYFEMFTQDYINANYTQMSKVTDKGYDSINEFIDDYIDESYLATADNWQKQESIIGSVRLAYLTGDLHQFARVVAMNSSFFGGKNLFEQYGVSIVDPNPGGYANGGYVMDAFAQESGKPDMGYLGCAPTILKFLNGDINRLNVRIVALANSEGSAIVVGAHSGIEHFDELSNMTLASPGETSIQHLLLLEVAKQNSMTVAKK
jgi:NitT/TauT family transport system substrate-binding protein